MIQLKDRKKCRKGKKEERIATSGIGINQQVDLESATSGMSKHNKWKQSGIAWDIMKQQKIVCDTVEDSM